MATQKASVKRVRKPPSKREAPADHAANPARSVRYFQVGEGLPNLTELKSELLDMTDVLMGREEPPIDRGVFTLHEVADAYFARASELTMLIQQAEREGHVAKGSAHYKFRTGELRTFLDMAKRASDLGSRRLTFAQMMYSERRDHALLGYEND